MASAKQTVLVIGVTLSSTGTGAQGQAIIKVLASTGKYHIIATTRDTSSSQAQNLAALPDVEVVASNAEHGYNPDVFSELAARSDAVFVNTDGFGLGEALETFWGIRLFELSARAGVKHLIYSGLDYNGKESNYDPDLYVGHYEGKARVQEWIHAQGKDFPMAWTIIRSGPYAEMLSDAMGPVFQEDGTAVFQIPLGEEGEMPFVSLVDFGWYIDWVLSNPDKSRGLDFGIAIEHAGGKTLAAAYTAATGKSAIYRDIPAEAWNSVAWANLPQKGQTKVGFLSVKDPNALIQTYDEDFAKWFNLYKASTGNKGLIKRDYGFLDEILPSRVKTMEEWMKREGYTGEKIAVLKRRD
ncbi:NAD(P)-binding protein [Coniochaeta ligniaria NRRL 30616]|uniref:NAD(P)-binding protein n=1 Tax=Coniochaeta ligniaria NRRL 30616 TaxID=1408157 RepID=A0A1J7JZI2_9PEZI|nr:NAD(P)-binding protein [Coniochaeta ligniaria NRRL 30616]